MKDILFMDTEVSDLPEYGGQLIDVTLLKVKLPDFTIVQQFSTRIKPTVSMREEVIEVTGISNEDLVLAPPFTDVYEQICSMIEDTQIVTKQVDFELAAMNNSFQVNNIEYEVDLSMFVELKDIERKLGLSKHNDEFVAKALGIKHEDECSKIAYMYLEIYRLAHQKGLLTKTD